MVGISCCRLCSFSQSILQIPAVVIVTLQQGLIGKVQGSPQRKRNFLLICTAILVIILLIRLTWQPRYNKSLWIQLQSSLMSFRDCSSSQTQRLCCSVRRQVKSTTSLSLCYPLFLRHNAFMSTFVIMSWALSGVKDASNLQRITEQYVSAYNSLCWTDILYSLNYWSHENTIIHLAEGLQGIA